jgi:hypothetical protein
VNMQMEMRKGHPYIGREGPAGRKAYHRSGTRFVEPGIFRGLFLQRQKVPPPRNTSVHPSDRSSRLDTSRPRPRPGPARRASARTHAWLASLLFNFTSDVCFVYLLGLMKTSSNTLMVLFTLILPRIKIMCFNYLLLKYIV